MIKAQEINQVLSLDFLVAVERAQCFEAFDPGESPEARNSCGEVNHNKVPE